MNKDNLDRILYVALPEKAITALLQINDCLNLGLAQSLCTIVSAPKIELVNFVRQPQETIHWTSKSNKYVAIFLGSKITAQSLPDIFSGIVDQMDYIAPEALHKLSAMSPRTRRYVARNREAIHPGRTDLPVLRTKSGWWISKNIGQEDLKRAIIALSCAADLSFGSDIIFPFHE